VRWPVQTIETEPEQVTLSEGVMIIQHQRLPRPALPVPRPGPAARVSAAPPRPGRGSRPRR
jgi:hypothetical protein